MEIAASRSTLLLTSYFVVVFLSLFGQLWCTTTVMELKSHAITSTRRGHVLPKQRRTKRSLFSSQQRQELVDKHNDLRRQVGASDMEYMTWNDYLASMADDWAKACFWGHGQPERPSGEPPYELIGQNLYVSNGTSDPLVGIQAFYDEVAYYDYETGACSNEPCGHYTQVVWSTSRELGCAYAFCPQMINIDLINGSYLVCNYGPAGNYVGQKPYEKGAACTRCKNGHLWCDDGLCRSDCTSQSTKCQCRADCKNCGMTVRANCSCACAPGWTGSDCSDRCEDRDSRCGANPGWPVSWCDKDYVYSNCPAMCSLCTVASGDATLSCPTITPESSTTTTGPWKTPSSATTPKSTTTTTRKGLNEVGGSDKISPGQMIFFIAAFLICLLA